MKKTLSFLLSLCLIMGTVAGISVFAASDAVEEDATALTIDDILSVSEWDNNNDVNTLIDNLDLDCYTVGEKNGSPITWSSSNTDVISNTGKVTRIAEDATVTVTATIGSNDDVVTKDFTFLVPAAFKNINGMPTAGESVWNDSFDGDSVIASSDYSNGYRTNVLQDSDVYCKDENGKLTIFSNKWGSEYFVRRYNTKLTGTLVYEMDISGDSNAFRLQLIDSNYTTKAIDMICYRKSNIIEINDKQYQIPQNLNNKTWKLTFFCNTTTDKAAIWLNNQIFRENIDMNAVSDINTLNIAILAAGSYDGRGSVIIDNFKAYAATESELYADANAVYNGLVEGLTYTAEDGNVYLLNDLNYAKTQGDNGSVFAYDCNSDYVTSDGIITNDVVDRNIKVNVTTSAEGYSVNKEYSFTIPGKYNRIGMGNLPVKDYSTLNKLSFNKAGESGYSYRKHDDQVGNESVSYSNGAINYKTSGVSSTQDTLFVLDSVCQSNVSEFVLDNTSKGLIIKIAGGGYNKWYISHLNGKLYASKADGSAVSSVNGEVGYSVTGIMNLTLVFDYLSATHTMDVWVNGVLVYENVPAANSSYKGYSALWIDHRTAQNGFCINPGGWIVANGTTSIYSITNYNVADTSNLPSVMKGEAVVSADKKTLSIPVIATNAEGEAFTGKLIYAVYAISGETKELLGVNTADIALNQYSHKEFTVTVNADSIPENYEVKVFFFNNMDDITPVTISDFPTA